MINAASLLSRFLEYAQIDTGANASSDSVPSSAKELELSMTLFNELNAMGASDVYMSEAGLVYATIPATTTLPSPKIGFCAHVDTSDDVATGPVKPITWKNYDGQPMVLPGNPSRVISTDKNPELAELTGKTIITSDGTTLLGADDKTGVAILMELAQILLARKEFPHGTILLCFTTDEEIGRGIDYLDLTRFNPDFAYTLDGGGSNGIGVETFSADMATLTFYGNNIHPAVGKGRLINAIKGACYLIDQLPKMRCSPETTDGREPFVHPIELTGNVEMAQLKLLIRSFDQQLNIFSIALENHVENIKHVFPGMRVEMKIVPQYRNMGEKLRANPEPVKRAEAALWTLGRLPVKQIIRGGTDGSRLTEKGIPTPNITSGQHNPHSLEEWACLEEMADSLEWVLEICRQ